MTWLSIISALFNLIRSITDYAHDKQLIDVGTHAALAKSATDGMDAIARAQKARELVRSEHERDPASIMRDDEFRRKD